MKTMRCELVQQIVSYREVGTELRDRIDTINGCGYSIKNVIETVASNNVHNKQGFIIMYECDTPDKCKEEITHIIEHVDEPDMFECCACGADLKEFTRYCPDCGRRNVEYKEEN